MSEENNEAHRFSVSMEDFIRFLEAKTGESDCPACKGETWTVIGVDKTDISYRLVTSLRDGSGPVTLSTFGVYCNNCGYIRQHLSRKVKDWVLENPGPEQLVLSEFDEADDNDVE
ncbi:TPA: hypothetical protein NIJ62_003520 [Pseudomonas aeruginosa]|nr:hypothetical protein [Pseudomonas aeruginosa]